MGFRGGLGRHHRSSDSAGGDLATHRHLPVAIALVVVVALAANQFYRLVVLEVSATDFEAHLTAASAVVAGERYLPHPLFHWLIKALATTRLVDLAQAAVVVCTLAAASAFLAQWIYLRHGAEGKVTPRLLLGVALGLSFVTAIYVPWVNPNPYLGQLSPNVYHSPTFVLMKPFLLVAFIAAAWLLDGTKQGWRWVSVCVGATAVGIAAKPSFALVFAPALAIVAASLFYRPRRGGIERRTLLVLTLGVLSTTGLLVGHQARRTFGPGSEDGAFNLGRESRVLVDEPFRHWRTRTPSVSFSIAAALAFPAWVLSARRRDAWARPSVHLAVWMLLLGMASYALLIDTVTPGVSNFGWSYMSGQVVTFLVAARELVHWPPGDQRGALAVAKLLFALHLVSGVLYYLKLASGHGLA